MSRAVPNRTHTCQGDGLFVLSECLENMCRGNFVCDLILGRVDL